MAFSFFKRKKRQKRKSTKSQYLDMVIKRVVKDTKDTVHLVFEPTDDFTYVPGQFITLILTIDGKKIRRSYSLCSSPALGEDPTITIKRVDGGIMSNYVNDELKAGDTVSIMIAMGSFVLPKASKNKRQIFLFGGGSGITPLLSIAKTVLAEESASKVVLVYANREETSVIFKEEIVRMEEKYVGRFDTVYYLEHPPTLWLGETGYLTKDSIARHIGDLKDEALGTAYYMTCGPAPLMDIVWGVLENVPQENKFRESFEAGTTSPSEIIANDNEPKRVKIMLEGEEYTYEVSPKKTILEAGLDENIDMPYSCQSGLCTACRGKCVSGDIKMTEDNNGLSDEEKAEGYVLLCISHPLSVDVKVRIG